MNSKEPQEYINEYFELIKEQYPNITLAQVNRICRTQFKLVKAEMESGNLRTIKIMYLGTFTVKRGRAIGMLRKTELYFRSGKINNEIRNYIQKIVKNYFKREYNEDLPLEKTIEL